jgi:FlaG/FlaF family flagellin (archaellin)
MTSDAVSPVVGVMLMLVVTIIIAAVVSAFAGGMADGTDKAPQATIEATPVIQSIKDTDTTNYVPDYPAGFTAANGIEFEHKGGSSFSLNDIKFTTESSSGVTGIISAADELPSSTCLPEGITDGGYFLKVANKTLVDKTISPGDKFMVYADNCYITTSGTTPGSMITWQPDGSPGHVYGNIDQTLKWAIVDKKSGQTITSGVLLLK